jgi:purine-binding chemotaxis protein CheW
MTEVGGRERTGAERGGSHLVFSIGPVIFAVRTQKVGEIIVFQELARTPSLPRCIRGLMNLRGTVLPVIDLAMKFGTGESPITPHTCIVVVETLHDGVLTPIGIITEAVHDVLNIPPSAIEPPPAFGTAVDVAYLSGMTKYGEGFALLMDADKVLSVEELLGTRTEISDFAAS